MQAMLWKEWQEQRWKIFAIWGIVLLMQLLRIVGGSGSTLVVVERINALIGLAVVVIPILMGLDVLCLERMRGTLAFLRSHPMSVGQILLPKFAVGSFGLLGAIVLLIGPMYYSMAAPMAEEQMIALRVTEMVPLWRLVWLTFITCWGFYVLSFTGSVLTDNPVKAFFVSVLLLFAFIFLLAHPGGGENEKLRVVVPFDKEGLSILVANATGYLWMLTLGILAFVGGCFVACMMVLKRFRQFTVHWAFVLGLMAITIAFCKDLVDTPPAEALYHSLPTGVVALDGWQREIVKEGDHVFVSGKKGLTVVNVADASQPQVVGELATPEWAFGWSDVGRHTVYGTGWHTQQSDSIKYAGVIAIDVGDPTAPRLKAELDLVKAEGIRQVGPVRAIGEYAYVCVVDQREARVVVVEDVGHTLREVASLVIDRTSDFDRSTKEILLGDSGTRGHQSAEELPWLSMNIDVLGHHIVLAVSSGLVVVDISDPKAPKELSRVAFHDAWAKYLGAPRRGLDIEDDKAYVMSYFPEALNEFDLSKPERPILSRRFYFNEFPQTLAVAEEQVYYSESLGHNGRRTLARQLKTAPIAEYGQTFYKSQIDDQRNRRILIEDDNLFLLAGDSLAIYQDAVLSRGSK